jgi:hypothetical protein
MQPSNRRKCDVARAEDRPTFDDVLSVMFENRYGAVDRLAVDELRSWLEQLRQRPFDCTWAHPAQVREVDPDGDT